MDISPVTDVLWKRFYQQQFGEDNMNLVVKKMKQSGARYKWKDLFKVKLLSTFSCYCDLFHLNHITLHSSTIGSYTFAGKNRKAERS
jgi:hypothetical protein